MEFAASQRSGPAPQGPVPALSVVVVSYNMRRELPRTLCTLGAKYQQNVVQDDYEVILVDNGSLHQGVNGDLPGAGNLA